MTNDKRATKNQQNDIEKIIKRETAKLFISGSLLILLGLGVITLALAEGLYLLKTPNWASTASLIVIVFVMMIIYSRPITRSLVRSSQDEYEYHINIASKAKAFDFLAPWVLVAVLFFNPGSGVNGLLALVLGISLIITARGGGKLDA